MNGISGSLESFFGFLDGSGYVGLEGGCLECGENDKYSGKIFVNVVWLYISFLGLGKFFGFCL